GCGGREGAGAFARAQRRVDDDLSFTRATDVGAFNESEQVLGIHRVRSSPDGVSANGRCGYRDDNCSRGGRVDDREENRAQAPPATRGGVIPPKICTHENSVVAESKRARGQLAERGTF